MPLSQKPHRPKADVELLCRERIAFETAEDLLRNAVGMQTSESRLADLVQSKEEAIEVPGSALVSFRNIPAAAESLAKDWVTWKPSRRLRRSSFVKVTGRIETHLHPYYLSRLGLGLRGAAGFLLHRWSDSLRCIPLGFVELRPTSSYAAVVAESPYVHFLMHFVAVGFAPRKGDWVVGRVSETQTRVGLNVTLLGLMNCLVRKWDLSTDLRFCPSTSRWLDVRSAEDDADGSVKGVDLTLSRVWLRLQEDTWVDSFNMSGQYFEFPCILGWPPEDVPRLLKEAKQEEAAAMLERRKGKAAAGKASASAAATGSGAGRKGKRAAETAAEEQPTPSKKVKKEPVAEEAESLPKPKKKVKQEPKAQEEPGPSKKRKRQEAAETAEAPAEPASSKKPKKSPMKVKKEPEVSASPKKPKKSSGKLQAD